jgi:hypothetical protein
MVIGVAMERQRTELALIGLPDQLTSAGMSAHHSCASGGTADL